MPRTNPAAIARWERDRAALRMRAEGATYTDIADACAFHSRQAARKAVVTLLTRVTDEDVTFCRALHRERLEALMRPLWVAATDPGRAIREAQASGSPPPPSQVRSIELLRRLLDQLADVEGTKIHRNDPDVHVDTRPIEGRVDVMAWVPDEAWMVKYVAVLKQAGLLDDGDVDAKVRLLEPGEEDA